jgi:hypothetical protein
MLKRNVSTFSSIYLLISALLLPAANAVEVLRTYQHPDRCVQPIYYPSTKAIEKMGIHYSELNDVTPLPVLSPRSAGLLKSHWLENEYQQLETFVRKWFHHFENKGDTALQHQTVCIGIFDDENSIGSGNHQYGDNTLLFGQRFLKTLRHEAKLAGHKTIPAPSRDMVYLHEFAHLLQKMNQSTVHFPKRPDSREIDLHADCVAGFLYRLDQLQKPSPSSTFAQYLYHQDNKHLLTLEHHAFASARKDAFTIGQHLAQSIQNEKHSHPGFRRGLLLDQMISGEIAKECHGSSYITLEILYND